MHPESMMGNDSPLQHLVVDDTPDRTLERASWDFDSTKNVNRCVLYPVERIRPEPMKAIGMPAKLMLASSENNTLITTTGPYKRAMDTEQKYIFCQRALPGFIVWIRTHSFEIQFSTSAGEESYKNTMEDKVQELCYQEGIDRETIPFRIETEIHQDKNGQPGLNTTMLYDDYQIVEVDPSR